MRLLVPAMCVLVGLGHAAALAQTTPIDLAALPAEIKSLKWQGIEMSAVSPLERCRALLLMNDVLDELRAKSTTDADLLSEYIDTNNLGADFAGQPPVPDSAPLTVASGLKIATALLRGPMAQSSYATQWAGVPATALAAYEQLYQSSSQWKWSAMADSRLRARGMMHYLEATGKLDDYVAWVPGAVAKRAQQQEAEAAQRRSAAAAEERHEAGVQQQQAQLERQEQELQQQRQATLQMQQSLCAAQQGQNQAQSTTQGTVVEGGYPGWYYGGVAALGASTWYRNGAYVGAAQARTDARVAAWHRGGGFRR